MVLETELYLYELGKKPGCACSAMRDALQELHYSGPPFVRNQRL